MFSSVRASGCRRRPGGDVWPGRRLQVQVCVGSRRAGGSYCLHVWLHVPNAQDCLRYGSGWTYLQASDLGLFACCFNSVLFFSFKAKPTCVFQRIIRTTSINSINEYHIGPTNNLYHPHTLLSKRFGILLSDVIASTILHK